jgi:hypothetical protein
VHGVTEPGLRLIVMGTGPFAVPMLQAIVAAGLDVAAVVTRPDRAPAGGPPPPPTGGGGGAPPTAQSGA